MWQLSVGFSGLAIRVVYNGQVTILASDTVYNYLYSTTTNVGQQIYVKFHKSDNYLKF